MRFIRGIPDSTVSVLFDRLFSPPAAEERRLYRHLLGTPTSLLDLGGGSGRLAATLLPAAATVVDLDRGALRRVPAPLDAVEGDFRALPFGDASFAAAVSGLLSLNYAGDEEGFRSALREAARVLRPGAAFAFELAAAWEPRRVQGLSESFEAPPLAFRFDYFDVLRQTAFGAVLATRMTLRDGAEERAVEAPLFVPGLPALVELFAQCGLSARAMHAPYDPESATLTPPADALRAVVAGVR